MKGIFYKDLKIFRLFFPLALIAGIIQVFNTQIPILPVYLIMLALSRNLKDSEAGWERFEATMPVKNEDIIASKYVINFGIILSFPLICLAIRLILGEHDLYLYKGLIGYFITYTVLLIIVAISITEVFRIEHGNARFSIFIYVAASFMLISLLSGAVEVLVESISKIHPVVAFILWIAVCGGIIYASYRKSLQNIKLKDIA